VNPVFKGGAINWNQSKKTFSNIMSEYESVYLRWKQSGNHSGFGEDGGVQDNSDKPPISEFTTTNYLLYLHEFLKEQPGLLQKFAARLAKDVFAESGATIASGDEEDKKPRSRKRSKKSSSSNSKENEDWGSTAFTARNDTWRLHSLREQSIRHVQAKDQQSDRRRKLFGQVASASGMTRKEIKKRLKDYEKRKQNGDTVLSQESQDSLDSLDSHSSTFDEILACQKEIARLEKEQKAVHKQLDSHLS